MKTVDSFKRNRIGFVQVFLAVVLPALAVMLAGCQSADSKTPAVEAGPLKAVVVTGGHGFETEPFFAMFDSYKAAGVVYDTVALKDEAELFDNIDNFPWKVIVLYNMTSQLSPQRLANFKQLVYQKHVGLVVLHHGAVAWRGNDDYHRMIGIANVFQGKTLSGTHYNHGREVQVHVADGKHPITAGLKDFTVTDETYKMFDTVADNHNLLTTTDPTSTSAIAWTRRQEGGRVCVILGGHDHLAWENPSFRQLLSQAIFWAGERMPARP